MLGLQDARGQGLRGCRPASTGTASCRTMGPVSRPSSTRWTVAPLTFTPCSKAWRWASRPGKAGSSDGCTFTTRPAKARDEPGGEQTHEARRGTRGRPGGRAGGSRARRRSPRRAFPRWSRKSAGTPAARARSRAGALSTFEITTAISPPSSPAAAASIRAWRLEPRPLTSTPIAGLACQSRPIPPHRNRGRPTASRFRRRPTRSSGPGSRIRVQDRYSKRRLRPRPRSR